MTGADFMCDFRQLFARVKGEYAQLRPVLFTGCDPMKGIQPRVFVWPGEGLFPREVVVQLCFGWHGGGTTVARHPSRPAGVCTT